MIYYQTDDLCIFSLISKEVYKNISKLSDEITAVSSFFGFQKLPQELKMHIHEFTLDDFQYIQQNNINVFSDSVNKLLAFTYNVNQIYVLNYESIKHCYSVRDYISIVVHECVHVLQAYYSRVPTSSYIWLYESVACYLSHQKKEYVVNKIVPWQDFICKFYYIDDAYAIAYEYGSLIFDAYDSEILDVIKEPTNYSDELRLLYTNYFHNKGLLSNVGTIP